ncbi:MAG: hypothetical protein IKJ01_01250 [Lachnospiraceae bacterium]|nr:hypothetical protein [Lachnospiraceae bacterium]
MTNRICDNYKDVTTFGTGEFEFLRKRYVDEFVENYENEHEYKEISAEQAKIIYAAILKDAENGILYEYNSEYSYKYQENKYGDLPYISLSFELPKQEKEEMNVYSSDSLFGTVHVESVEYYDYENSWASVYIRYGKKCEHIIQALIETGLLDSVDDIWWGNEIVE